MFRVACEDDTERVVRLVESAYRGDQSRRGWTTEADLLDGQRTDPEEVRGLIAREGSRVLVADGASGALEACCHIERKGDACYFGMFAVLPEAQGTGIGGALLREAERVAKDDWRCARVEMTVIDLREELIRWYERRGYARTGVYKPFPYGDARFGLPRRADLRFEVLAKTI